MINSDDVIVFKCGIIFDLLNGKEPTHSDYVAENGLTNEGFSKIIDEMVDDKLITNVISARAGIRLVNWWKQAEVTPKGKAFFEKHTSKF